MSDSDQFMLRWRGRQTGPFAIADINRMLDDHKIGTGHEILFEGEWITLETFFSRRQIASQPAPAPHAPLTVQSSPNIPAAGTVVEERPVARVRVPVAPQVPAGGGRPRYRLVFALLAVFLGFLGAHNFYARQWMTGILQLLLSVATFLMGFGIIATMVWAMVEALAVRKDGVGMEMI